MSVSRACVDAPNFPPINRPLTFRRSFFFSVAGARSLLCAISGTPGTKPARTFGVVHRTWRSLIFNLLKGKTALILNAERKTLAWCEVETVKLFSAAKRKSSFCLVEIRTRILPPGDLVLFNTDLKISMSDTEIMFS